MAILGLLEKKKCEIFLTPITGELHRFGFFKKGVDNLCGCRLIAYTV
jgi:hypothetical protein